MVNPEGPHLIPYRCYECGSDAIMQEWSVMRPMNRIADPESETLWLYASAAEPESANDFYWCLICRKETRPMGQRD